MALSTWGIAAAGTTVNVKPGCFDIVSEQGNTLWTWSQMKDRITSTDLNPAYTDWKESVDIRFETDDTAVAWFKWLQGYATTKAVGGVPFPQSSTVSVRTTYHSWLQKTPKSIQHRRSVIGFGCASCIEVTGFPTESCCMGSHSRWSLAKFSSIQNTFHLR